MIPAKRVGWRPRDFLFCVAGLTAREIAVYALLLAMIADAGGSVPADEATLARRCRMRRATFAKSLDVLVDMDRLQLVDGHLAAGPRCGVLAQ